MELLKKKSAKLKYEIFLRPNTSDEALYQVLIEQEEYGYIGFVREPRIIIDAGANIGLSAIWFANRYPDAMIYAIEPAADNYQMLKLNTMAYSNIITLNAALMGNDGQGTLIDPGLGDLAYQVQFGNQKDENSIACITVDALCEQYHLNHIDMFKIDIEGAEVDVFSKQCSWLDKVDVLVIELHERICAGCNQIVFDAIKSRFQLIWIGGENFYFARSGVANPIIPSIFTGVAPKPLPIEEVWHLKEQLDENSNSFQELLNPIFRRIDGLEGIYPRVDKLEEIYRRVDKLEGLYHRVDELERVYHRVDELEGLYRRVDELERIYPRVDELEGLYRRVDLLELLYHRVDLLEENEKRFALIERSLEELKEKLCIFDKIPLNRLFSKLKKKKRRK